VVTVEKLVVSDRDKDGEGDADKEVVRTEDWADTESRSDNAASAGNENRRFNIGG